MVNNFLNELVTFLNFGLWLELREQRKANAKHYDILILKEKMRLGGLDYKGG